MRLEIAPRVDTVQVVGSTIELPATLQGSSVDVIPSARVRSSNEPFAMDLLRYIPGVAFNQSGSPGGVTSLFLRGGNSNLNLVQIDGVPVNSFGGSFDFAHIPVEAVDHVDFIRANRLYGSYANAGAIDCVTRRRIGALSLLWGGSHSERRLGITGTGTVAASVCSSLHRATTATTWWPATTTATKMYCSMSRGCAVSRCALPIQLWRTGALWLPSQTDLCRIDMVSRARITSSTAPTTRRTFVARTAGTVRDFFCTAAVSPPNTVSVSAGRARHGRRVPSACRRTIRPLRCLERTRVGANSFITDAGFSTFPIERNDRGHAENRYR